MAFKMKGSPMHKGTASHKEALKLNKSMDGTSLSDGRAGSSPFQKTDYAAMQKRGSKKYHGLSAEDYKTEVDRQVASKKAGKGYDSHKNYDRKGQETKGYEKEKEATADAAYYQSPEDDAKNSEANKIVKTKPKTQLQIDQANIASYRKTKSDNKAEKKAERTTRRDTRKANRQSGMTRSERRTANLEARVTKRKNNAARKTENEAAKKVAYSRTDQKKKSPVAKLTDPKSKKRPTLSESPNRRKRPISDEELAANRKEEAKYRADDASPWNAETRAAKKAENAVRKEESTRAATKKDNAYDLKQRKIAYKGALKEYYSKMDLSDGKYKGKRPVL